MRIYTAQLVTESNTFSPIPTGRRDFEEMGIHHGTASELDPDGVFAVLTLWRTLATAQGHEVVEGLAAQAQPGGRTLRGVYEEYRDHILRDVEAKLPLDAILLNMHGAMSAEGYDDCEGDLVTRLRALVGPDVSIGLELDLHCHLTTATIAATDIVICYKHYPHIDIGDRAAELFALTVATAEGTFRPVTSVVDCHMTSLWHTTREPMTSFVRKMGELESEKPVLSISFGHGFPWGDVAESGARLWVITDGAAEIGDRIALDLANELFEQRHAMAQPLVTIDEMVDRVEASTAFPIVAADGADNPGGGASSDSSYVLQAVLDREVDKALIAFFYDPELARLAADIGVGAEVDIRIGGKVGRMSGDPVDLRVEVKAVLHDHYQAGLGQRWPLGTTVWLRGPHDLDLIVSSTRSQPFDPDSITALGIDLGAKRLIVVKSIQHFHAGFAPIAQGGVLYIAAPGALSPDFATIPYQVRSLDFWPRIDAVEPKLVMLEQRDNLR